MSVTPAHIATFRAFNRFQTQLIGALDRRFLDSPYSLTEARILYEIAQGNSPTAADLAKGLRLDPSYLSRALRGLEQGGLIERPPSATDRRAATLILTEAGKAAFAELDRAADAQAAKLLEPLPAPERDRLVKAMASVTGALSPPAAARAATLLREPQPGDIGWVVHRHGALYAAEYGWDDTFEALVAEIAGAFLKRHDPRRERCFIAERQGEILGSVFIVDAGEETAKLRLLYVEPHTRGQGLGRSLVEEALCFARQAGYRKMTLWTNDILVAARRIYETAGFRLVATEPHASFGKELVGEFWRKDL